MDNIVEKIQNMASAMRRSRFEDSEQMSLGQLIYHLEKIKDKQMSVHLDFCNMPVTNLDSYRGYYDELAIGFHGNYGGPYKSVEEFLKECKEAIGKTYQGWKGGDFVMHDNTPIWVANPGCTGSTFIIGVVDEKWGVVLKTGVDN